MVTIRLSASMMSVLVVKPQPESIYYVVLHLSLAVQRASQFSVFLPLPAYYEYADADYRGVAASMGYKGPKVYATKGAMVVARSIPSGWNVSSHLRHASTTAAETEV